MYTGKFNFAKSVFFYFVYYTWAAVLRSEPEPVLNSPAPAPAKKDRLRPAPALALAPQYWMLKHRYGNSYWYRT